MSADTVDQDATTAPAADPVAGATVDQTAGRRAIDAAEQGVEHAQTTTGNSARGSSPGSAVPFDMAPAADSLPAPVVAVLDAVLVKVKDRPGATFDQTLTTRAARQMLDVLTSFAAMRKVVAAEASPGVPATCSAGVRTHDGTLAADLVSADAATAAAAGEKVRRLLDHARSTARTARRRDKAAERPSAEERAAERDKVAREKFRTERDRARVQAETAAAERDAARDRLADMTAEAELARDRYRALERQMSSLRDSLTFLPAAAQRMFDSLQPPTESGTVRPPRDAPPVEPMPLTDLRVAAETALTGVLSAEQIATVGDWLPRLLRTVANPPRMESFTELDLTVDVLGAGDEVGGSCVLISAGGTRILVDCGTRPSGKDAQSMAPPHIERALASRLDAIVVTHAHNDHGGWIPAVIAQQPHLPVFATRATCDLLATMWTDSAKVMLKQAQQGDRFGGLLPPYSQADVDVAYDRLADIGFGHVQRIGALDVQLFTAGHIVGAAGVVVTAGGRRVVVTGDVSGPGQGTVGGFAEPDSARFADLVLLESTYAGQDHTGSRAGVVNDFVRSVEQTMDAGGIALVPSFALGRAQEVALICAERLPGVEVLIDGLARDVSETYQYYQGPHGSDLVIFRGNVRPVERGKTLDERIRFKSGVVIATSGMLTSGPVIRWAERVLPDPRSALMLVGYQDPTSPGAHLRRLADGSTLEPQFRLPMLDGSWKSVEVLAKVENFSLGAHANEQQLVGIADKLRPHRLMMVHGDRNKQPLLGRKLLDRGHLLASATQVWQSSS